MRDMLIELKKVRQKKGEHFRRWWEDSYFDLIVWYERDKTVHGFQLCYNRLGDEKALTWFREQGFFHDRVDTGSRNRSNFTPILVADGLMPAAAVADRFEESSRTLDPVLVQLILERIHEYDEIQSEGQQPAK